MSEVINIKELNERIERESVFVDTLNMEMGKVIVGQKHLVDTLLIGLLSNGHILLEGVPGLAKTLAITTLAQAVDAKFSRIQFTPDTLPSDITGFTMWNRKTGEFEYREGAANCQLLLADEINRTSPKTQSALLEIMEERTITVDGETHALPAPFICIATQNPFGFAGTQALPESQLDRFMVSLSIGYPSIEDQMKIISAQRYANPLDELHPVTTAQNVIEVQKFLSSVKVMDDMLRYAIELCEKTRIHPLIELGISPRGVAALVRMARASAVLHERNYVVPEDIQSVFLDVCAHRLVLRPQARVDGMNARDVLRGILSEIRPPALSVR